MLAVPVAVAVAVLVEAVVPEVAAVAWVKLVGALFSSCATPRCFDTLHSSMQRVLGCSWRIFVDSELGSYLYSLCQVCHSAAVRLSSRRKQAAAEVMLMGRQ